MALDSTFMMVNASVTFLAVIKKLVGTVLFNILTYIFLYSVNPLSSLLVSPVSCSGQCSSWAPSCHVTVVVVTGYINISRAADKQGVSSTC